MVGTQECIGARPRRRRPLDRLSLTSAQDHFAERRFRRHDVVIGFILVLEFEGQPLAGCTSNVAGENRKALATTATALDGRAAGADGCTDAV